MLERNCVDHVAHALAFGGLFAFKESGVRFAGTEAQWPVD